MKLVPLNYLGGKILYKSLVLPIKNGVKSILKCLVDYDSWFVKAIIVFFLYFVINIILHFNFIIFNFVSWKIFSNSFKKYFTFVLHIKCMIQISNFSNHILVSGKNIYRAISDSCNLTIKHRNFLHEFLFFVHQFLLFLHQFLFFTPIFVFCTPIFSFFTPIFAFCTPIFSFFTPFLPKNCF